MTKNQQDILERALLKECAPLLQVVGMPGHIPPYLSGLPGYIEFETPWPLSVEPSHPLGFLEGPGYIRFIPRIEYIGNDIRITWTLPDYIDENVTGIHFAQKDFGFTLSDSAWMIINDYRIFGSKIELK